MTVNDDAADRLLWWGEGGRAQAHVADTTDRGHLATSGWKSFGNVPCLCEYHHLSTVCLSVASVLQTVLV